MTGAWPGATAVCFKKHSGRGAHRDSTRIAERKSKEESSGAPKGSVTTMHSATGHEGSWRNRSNIKEFFSHAAEYTRVKIQWPSGYKLPY